MSKFNPRRLKKQQLQRALPKVAVTLAGYYEPGRPGVIVRRSALATDVATDATIEVLQWKAGENEEAWQAKVDALIDKHQAMVFNVDVPQILEICPCCDDIRANFMSRKEIKDFLRNQPEPS